jgi:hypothetical protein
VAQEVGPHHAHKHNTQFACGFGGTEQEPFMKPRATFEKLRKERQRQERKRDKAERRKQRKEAPSDQPLVPEGEDPDIAHIKWGPQPVEDSDQ